MSIGVVSGTHRAGIAQTLGDQFGHGGFFGHHQDTRQIDVTALAMAGAQDVFFDRRCQWGVRRCGGRGRRCFFGEGAVGVGAFSRFLTLVQHGRSGAIFGDMGF